MTSHKDRFKETFDALHNRVCDLKDMVVDSDEWDELDRSERSAIEDMIGLCESYGVYADAALKKYSPIYAELHDKNGNK